MQSAKTTEWKKTDRGNVNRKMKRKGRVRIPAVAHQDLVASLERWDAGSIPSPAQRIKDPALLQLPPTSQLRLDRIPCPGTPYAMEQQEKKKAQHKKQDHGKQENIYIYIFMEKRLEQNVKSRYLRGAAVLVSSGRYNKR